MAYDSQRVRPELCGSQPVFYTYPAWSFGSKRPDVRGMSLRVRDASSQSAMQHVLTDIHTQIQLLIAQDQVHWVRPRHSPEQAHEWAPLGASGLRVLDLEPHLVHTSQPHHGKLAQHIHLAPRGRFTKRHPQATLASRT